MRDEVLKAVMKLMESKQQDADIQATCCLSLQICLVMKVPESETGKRCLKSAVELMLQAMRIYEGSDVQRTLRRSRSSIDIPI